MADHGEVEYATADGNDYLEHEGTYERFLHPHRHRNLVRHQHCQSALRSVASPTTGAARPAVMIVAPSWRLTA